MFIAMVKGTVTATRKHASMAGARLVIVQPIDPVGGQPTGFPQIAADVLGAAVGTRVLVVSDGRGVQDMLKADAHCPMRLGIMALIDPPASGS
jgi:ethanolamine utilization protein EutN